MNSQHRTTEVVHNLSEDLTLIKDELLSNKQLVGYFIVTIFNQPSSHPNEGQITISSFDSSECDKLIGAVEVTKMELVNRTLQRSVTELSPYENMNQSPIKKLNNKPDESND